jgi:Spy/CpxP family protein refolding chaperone
MMQLISSDYVSEVLMKHTLLMGALATAIVIFAGAVRSYAQVPAQQSPPVQAQQVSPFDDPIRQLNLTPEQREKIRLIREENKAERAQVNERARETRRALDLVLDTDSPDEALLEQRLHDVAEAQAAATRMRVLTEVRIRRVLTREQLATLRMLREQARQLNSNRPRIEREQQRRLRDNVQNQRFRQLLRQRQLQRRLPQ